MVREYVSGGWEIKKEKPHSDKPYKMIKDDRLILLSLKNSWFVERFRFNLDHLWLVCIKSCIIITKSL